MTSLINYRGFTLIELLVTLVLIVILTTIGVPAFRHITTTNRMATEMNALVGDIQLARSEAIKRGYPVGICPSDSPTSTQSHCLTGKALSWSRGWVVYTLPFGANTATVLRLHGPLTSDDTLVSNVGGAIKFNRNGFTTHAQTLTLNDANANTSERRCIVLSIVGRVRLDTKTHCP